MNFVRGALSDADVLLYVTDTVERDDERAAEIIDRIRQSGVPTLVVVNKIDLSTQEALEALVEKWRATLPAAHRRTRSTGRMQRKLENIWEIETAAQYFRLPEH